MSDTEVLLPSPTAEVPASVAPGPEPPAAPMRREPSGPVLVPFDSALPGVSSADIRAELARRERRVPKLMAEREQVLEQMAAIEDALAGIGEPLPGVEAEPREARRPRARNAVSLKDAIAAAVAVGATVSPAEVAEAVQRSGYASTATNLGQMVASALARDGRFERIGRGRYTRAPG